MVCALGATACMHGCGHEMKELRPARAEHWVRRHGQDLVLGCTGRDDVGKELLCKLTLLSACPLSLLQTRRSGSWARRPRRERRTGTSQTSSPSICSAASGQRAPRTGGSGWCSDPPPKPPFLPPRLWGRPGCAAGCDRHPCLDAGAQPLFLHLLLDFWGLEAGHTCESAGFSPRKCHLPHPAHCPSLLLPSPCTLAPCKIAATHGLLAHRSPLRVAVSWMGWLRGPALALPAVACRLVQVAGCLSSAPQFLCACGFNTGHHFFFYMPSCGVGAGVKVEGRVVSSTLTRQLSASTMHNSP